MEGRYNKYGRREIDDHGGVWRCRAVRGVDNALVLECLWNDGRYGVMLSVPLDWRQRSDEELVELIRATSDYPFRSPVSPG